jgi:hypothetical protein
VITDKNMAAFADALKMGSKYKTEIFPTSSEGLERATEWISRI